MDAGVRNRKNKSSPKAEKISKESIEELTPDENHDVLKQSIEQLKHLNENINRDSVSTVISFVHVCACDLDPLRTG